MRCLMCEEPTTMYIPSDDVDGVGLHSCGVCGFEIEAPRDEPVRVDEHRKLTATTTTCRFPLEMADNPRDSTLVGGGPGLRIPREMADSYTAL